MSERDLFKLTKKYLKNKNVILKNNAIQFERNNGTYGTVQLMEDTKWEDIKKYINATNAKKDSDICKKCDKYYPDVMCNKCTASICKTCYYKNLVNNNGLFICDNCNFTYGSISEPCDLYLNIEPYIRLHNLDEDEIFWGK